MCRKTTFNFFVSFSDEKLFRAHCKKLIDKFTNNVIDAAQREITMETDQFKSFANNSLNLIKPETVKFLSKANALIDKHLAIPSNLPVEDNYRLQNTPDMDDYEMKCKKDIADLEKLYKQQTYMINSLKKELEIYDDKIIDVAEADQLMLSSLEKYLEDNTESNLNEE